MLNQHGFIEILPVLITEMENNFERVSHLSTFHKNLKLQTHFHTTEKEEETPLVSICLFTVTPVDPF